MDAQAAAPGRELLGQLQDLLPCQVRGVGGAAKWIISSTTPRFAIM